MESHMFLHHEKPNSRLNYESKKSSHLELQNSLTKSLAMIQPFRKGLALVRMKYHGKEIPGLSETEEEITIYQQHCGGNSVCIFSDSINQNSIFSFTSQRHSTYPFSLTFFNNGRQIGRINTCCEYKHKWFSRLRGVQSMFSIENVSGGEPCCRCRTKAKKKLKRVITSRKESESDLKIPIEIWKAISEMSVNPESETSEEDEDDDNEDDDSMSCSSENEDDLEIPMDAVTSSPETSDTESRYTDQHENAHVNFRNDKTESDYGVKSSAASSSSSS